MLGSSDITCIKAVGIGRNCLLALHFQYRQTFKALYKPTITVNSCESCGTVTCIFGAIIDTSDAGGGITARIAITGGSSFTNCSGKVIETFNIINIIVIIFIISSLSSSLLSSSSSSSSSGKKI